MVITFNDVTDDKDIDTRLELFIILGAPGAPAVAYSDVGSNTLIPNNSHMSFTVPPFGTGFKFSDLPVAQIVVKIAPRGHDTWRFSFKAVVNFANGSTATVKTNNLVLDQDANQLTYPLSGAVIA
jgi:hypothetical protein